jgi:hypothetical protein
VGLLNVCLLNVGLYVYLLVNCGFVCLLNVGLYVYLLVNCGFVKCGFVCLSVGELWVC